MAYSLLFADYYFVIRLKFEKFEFSNEFLSRVLFLLYTRQGNERRDKIFLAVFVGELMNLLN